MVEYDNISIIIIGCGDIMNQKIKNLLFTSFFLLFCSFSFTAHAAILKNLYQASFPVPNDTQKLSQTNVEKAYENVLIKVSGNPNIATLSAIRATFIEASIYIQSYGFNPRKPTTQNTDPVLLTVNFDPKSINQVLRQANQAIWGKKRPSILVWLSVQTPTGTTMINSETQSDISTSVLQDADARGIPLILPLMDLQDISAKTLEDLLARYSASGVLQGRIISPSPDKWHGQWELILNQQKINWTTTGTSSAQVIAAAVNRVTNTMVNQFAVLSGAGLDSWVTIKVIGIKNLSDYANVMKILRDLTPVLKTEVVKVDASDLVLKLDVAGGSQGLMNAMGGQKKFAPVPANNQTTDAKINFTYQWNP